MKILKKIFIFYTFITLLFFGVLIKFEFATDTYAVFNFNKEEVFMQYAMSGRFITGLTLKILSLKIRIHRLENTQEQEQYSVHQAV